MNLVQISLTDSDDPKTVNVKTEYFKLISNYILSEHKGVK